MNLPTPEPPRRTVGFKEVEVIELPMVAGHNHPSHHFEESDTRGDEGSETDCEQFDSAAITLDWQAQTRTKINVDDYEEKKKKMRMGKKLQRMSRAVRKRILRNIGVETSDIESEDERRSTKERKKKKSKKKKKKRSKGTKESSAKAFRRNPFRFGNDSACMPPRQPQDRFSSGSQELTVDHADNAPRLPQRRDNPLGLPPARPRAESEDLSSHSPSQSRHSTDLNRNPEIESPGRSIRSRSLNFLFPNTSVPRDVHMQESENAAISPDRQRRKSHLDNVASAIGILASQPVKLAKQPVRLAKYTGKKVRQRVGRVRRSGGRESSDDDDEAGLETDMDNQPCPSRFHASGEDTDVSSRSITYPSRPTNSDHGRNFDHRYGNDRVRNTEPLSPPTRRRSSLSHVTNVIGVLAKQPVILAKQPVRLAKYTTKKVRRRVSRGRNTKSPDDDDDDSLDGIDPSTATLPAPFPPRPPLCFNSSCSDLFDSDDDVNLQPLEEESGHHVSTPVEVNAAESGDDDINDSKHTGSARTQHKASRRRSSLQHMTNAIGTVAKQPYKLAKYTAKQPIKLAKYTGNSIRKRMRKKKDDDSIISNPEDNIVSEDDTILDYNEGYYAVLPHNDSKEQQPPTSSPLPVDLLTPMMDGSDGNSSIEYSVSLKDGAKVKNSNDSLDLSDVVFDDLEGVSEDEDIVEPDSIHTGQGGGVTKTTGNASIISGDGDDMIEGNDATTIPLDIAITTTCALGETTFPDEEKENSFRRGTKSYRISMAGDVHSSDELLPENGVICCDGTT